MAHRASRRGKVGTLHSASGGKQSAAGRMGAIAAKRADHEQQP